MRGNKPCEIQTTSSVLYYTTMGPPKAPRLRVSRVDLYQVRYISFFLFFFFLTCIALWVYLLSWAYLCHNCCFLHVLRRVHTKNVNIKKSIYSSVCLSVPLYFFCVCKLRVYYLWDCFYHLVMVACNASYNSNSSSVSVYKKTTKNLWAGGGWFTQAFVSALSTPCSICLKFRASVLFLCCIVDF